MHALIYTMGGIPLLYLGDEIAQPNDPSFSQRPAEATDNRWIHRPFFADERLAQALAAPATPEGRVLAAIVRLAGLRRRQPALGVGSLQPLELDQRYTLAFERRAQGQRLTIVANLSEHSVEIDSAGLGAGRCRDLWHDQVHDPRDLRMLASYELMILASSGAT